MWSLVSAMNAAAAVGQPAGEGRGEQPGRADVDGVVPVEALDAGVQQPGVDALAVGHDQGVEWPEDVGRPVDQCRGLLGVLEVGGEQLDLTAGAAELIGQPLGIVRRAGQTESPVVRLPEGQRQVPAVLGQTGGDPRSDPSQPTHTRHQRSSCHPAIVSLEPPAPGECAARTNAVESSTTSPEAAEFGGQR